MREDINKLAAWMMAHGYATGPGETIEDLLDELDWQIAENWNRAMINGIETEREACAKVAEDMGNISGNMNKTWRNGCFDAATAIRARGAGMECKVKDCENHSDHGVFVGFLCMPCHTFLTTGEGTYSQLYRNTVVVEREACAKLCEAEGERVDSSWVSCAAAIRARRQG